MTSKTSEAAMVLPADPSRLTDRERRDLDLATAELGRARNMQAKTVAQDKIHMIRRKVQQRITVADRAESLAQTVALAHGRGEEVEADPKTGRVRIARDGLKSLFDRGRLTRTQYESGLLFRSGWEGRGADLGAQTYGDGGGGAHNNDIFVARRCLQALARVLAPRSERAVAALAPSAKPTPHPEALQMLRRVAGDGYSINSFGEGRAQKRNLDALVFALGVVEQVARDIRAEERRAREF